ncbi:MAG: SAM-dependent methyltransferase, partial [Oscillatoriales cyanobacterium]
MRPVTPVGILASLLENLVQQVESQDGIDRA